MPAPRTEAGRASARSALGRYRFMAYVTGVMLLILCVEMLLKYVILSSDHEIMQYLNWIPMAHGFVYVIYLLTVGDLWSRMRWDVKTLVVMVLAGVIPVLSFVLERRITAKADGELGGGPVATETAGDDILSS